MSKKALGKGLGAFIPEEFSILKDERFAELDIEDVKPNPFQPRMKFDDQTIDELAQSIRESGIVQPVIVAPEDDHYKIIVGERRWRAAQKAGLRKIPVLIRNIPKDKQLEVSLIENIHREELNALEIAQAYQRLIDEHGYAQHELADKVGKDRSSVTNYLRLLKLPQEIQDRLDDGDAHHGTCPGPAGPGGPGGPALRLPPGHRQEPIGPQHGGPGEPAEKEGAAHPAQPGRPGPPRPPGGDAQVAGDEGHRRREPEQGRAEDILFLSRRPEPDLRQDQRSKRMKDKPRELNETKLAGLIDMESDFKGELSFKGSFRIEGNFKGTITSDSLLVVGERGKVEADVKVGQLVINGEIRGKLEASERVEVHNRGRVFGTILAPVLIVEEGAYLEATCQTKGAATPAALPKEPSGL